MLTRSCLLTEQSQCHPNPCRNLGICTEVEKDYECTCQPGFKGTNCDSKFLKSTFKSMDKTVALEKKKTFQIIRVQLFSCQVCNFLYLMNALTKVFLLLLVTDPCSPSPCKNGGTCAEVGSSFTCDCRIGWIGKDCGSEFWHNS